MEITKMLLTRRLQQMHDEFLTLYRDIKRFDLDEAQDLKMITHVKLQEIEMLQLSLEHLNSVSGTAGQTNTEESLRMMKHDYHAITRKWYHLKTLHERNDAVIAA